jgi:CHAD domain-containing protein
MITNVSNKINKFLAHIIRTKKSQLHQNKFSCRQYFSTYQNIDQVFYKNLQIVYSSFVYLKLFNEHYFY